MNRSNSASTARASPGTRHKSFENSKKGQQSRTRTGTITAKSTRRNQPRVHTYRSCEFFQYLRLRSRFFATISSIILSNTLGYFEDFEDRRVPRGRSHTFENFRVRPGVFEGRRVLSSTPEYFRARSSTFGYLRVPYRRAGESAGEGEAAGGNKRRPKGLTTNMSRSRKCRCQESEKQHKPSRIKPNKKERDRTGQRRERMHARNVPTLTLLLYANKTPPSDSPLPTPRSPPSFPLRNTPQKLLPSFTRCQPHMNARQKRTPPPPHHDSRTPLSSSSRPSPPPSPPKRLMRKTPLGSTPDPDRRLLAWPRTRTFIIRSSSSNNPAPRTPAVSDIPTHATPGQRRLIRRWATSCASPTR